MPREIEMFDTAMFYSFQLIRRLSVELNFFFFFEYFVKKPSTYFPILTVIISKS